MNDDVYNKSGSSLQDAYAKLNSATLQSRAIAQGQQIDNNGVALNTAPISTYDTQEETQEKGNFFVRTLGTVEQATRNIASGALNIFEGAADFLIGGIGGLFDSNWAEEAVKFDVTEAILGWTDDYLSLNAIYKSQTGDDIYGQSYVYEASEKVQDIILGVEQGIGSSLALAGLMAIPYAGLPLAAAGAGGSSFEEALSDEDYSGNYWEAFGYGTLSGITEMGIEYLSAGVGKVLGKLGLTNSIGAILPKLSKNKGVRETLTTLAGTFVSEGLEEVASDLLDPLYKSVYNGKDVATNFEEDVSGDSLATTFLVGGISGALMGGTTMAIQNIVYSPEGIQITKDIQENRDKLKQAQEDFNNAVQTGDLATQEQAQANFDKVRNEVVASMTEIGTRINNLKTKYQYRLGQEVKIDGEKVKIPLSKEFYDIEIEQAKEYNPVEIAVAQTMEFVNDQRLSNNLPELDYEFVNDNNEFNGMYVDSENKIYLSTNPQKAIRQVLAHEITHTYENTNEYNDVKQEIIATMKESGEYQKISKKIKEMYAKQNKTISDEALENELVADYVSDNFFGSYSDIQNSFKKQSTFNKFIGLLKKLRKSSTSNKAKDLYLKMIQANQNKKVVEKPAVAKLSIKEESIKDIMNPEKIIKIDSEEIPQEEITHGFKSDIMSICEENDIEIVIINLTVVGSYAKGTNNSNSDLDLLLEYEGDIDDYDLFNILNDEDNDLSYFGVPVDINPINSEDMTTEDWLEENYSYNKNEKYSLKEKESSTKYDVSDIVNGLEKQVLENRTTEDVIKTAITTLKREFKVKLENDNDIHKFAKATTKYLVNHLTIDGKSLESFYNTLDIDMPYETFKTSVIDNLNISTYRALLKSLKDGKIVSMEKLVNSIDKGYKSIIKELKSMNRRARLSVLKLERLRNWFKKIVDKEITYHKGSVNSLLVEIKKDISKMKFNSYSFKPSAATRNLIVSLKDHFFNNPLVKSFINPEAMEYIDEIFRYETDFIEKNKDSKRPIAIETDKVISSNYPLLEGKTEAEVVVDLLTEVKRISQASIGTVYAELDGEQVIARDVARDEYKEQKKVNRNKLWKKLSIFRAAKQYLSSLVDMEAYTTELSHGDKNSLFTKLYNKLFNARKDQLLKKQLLQDKMDAYLSTKEGKRVLDKMRSSKDLVKVGNSKITIGEAVSLYMLSKTDNAQSHLTNNGIAITNKKNADIIRIDGKEFIKYLSEKDLEYFKDLKGTVKDISEKYPELNTRELIDNEIDSLEKKALENMREDIKSQIGTEFNEIINIMEEGYRLSSEMYVEASEKTLGFAYTPKEYYYPTASFNEELVGDDALANKLITSLSPSYTKASKGGTNRLNVSDAVDTFMNFTNSLSTYSAITTEIINIKKFLNSKVKDDMTLMSYMKENVDKNFEERINGLFMAMQGIRSKATNAAERIFKKVRGLGARASLALNIRVLFMQPTSFFRGINYIKGRNLLKGALGKTKGLYGFDVAMKNSSLLKDRYKDSNYYNAEAVGSLNKADRFTNVLLTPIELADKLPITRIWYACQYETMVDGKVDLDAALELFETVLYNTQAQYDPLGNGSITRTENELVDASLMYTSETRKQFSRIYQGVLTAVYNKDFKPLIKASASSLTDIALITAITVFLNSLRGSYDDKDKEEIVQEILLDDVFGSVVGMFPVFKDFYNTIVNDFDYQLTGFSQVFDIADVLKTYIPKLMDTSSTQGEIRSALLQIATRFAHLFGIPARNIYNDLLYFGGLTDELFDTESVLKLKNIYYNTSPSMLTSLSKKYKEKGDLGKLATALNIRFENSNIGKLEQSGIDEITRLYANDSIKSMPKQISDKMLFDGKEIELSSKQISVAKSVYSVANEILLEMIKSRSYATLNDLEKALAIKRLYDTYYDLAKSTIISDYKGNKLSQVADFIDVEKLIPHLSKIGSLKPLGNQSKKKAVVNYINKQRLSANEKYLLLDLAGYSMGDKGEKQLSSFLRSKGMNKKEIELLLK